MYSNRPPPEASSMGAGGSPLPPFPPTFSPNGPPPGFPPFPPNGFVRPPFAPTLPVPANPLGSGTGPGMRPPPHAGNGMPTRPSHPGLGLPPLPTGMPAPPHLPSNTKTTPSFVREVKTTSVFVGSIAPGIADDVLRSLLNACGPLHELKRIVGASGKPQAFAFALFESPEVVMRCIRCLNGIELPDMSLEGRGMNPSKALVVKVDEKTREFLDEFEKTLGRSDDEEAADAMSRRTIAHLVARLTDPNAAVPTDINLTPQQSTPFQVFVPAHLQDLKEGDLPEAQRVAVLDQIAGFREAAMRQDQEKRRQDDERDRNRSTQQPYQPALADYGYGTRALPKQTGGRKWSQPQDKAPDSVDPQNYSTPVPFVKAKASETRAESARTDEEEEQLRLQQRERDRDVALRDRERRVEARERGRIEGLNRELAFRKQQKDLEERARKQMIERLDLWDDDEKAERGREWFYTDRPRWRASRQQRRTIEFQEDVRDRQAEEDEIRQLELESEEFLRRQMAEMSELEERQRAKGLLSEDAAPIRLALDSIAAKPTEESFERPDRKPQAILALDAEDEEDAAVRRKARTLVKLDDDASTLDDGVLRAERAAQRNAQLLGVRRILPKDRRRLWEYRIEWKALPAELLDKKIIPLIRSQTKRYLGDVDEDVVDFVIEHIKDRKGPDELMDGLEPILAEESVPFTSDTWRQLVFESIAYRDGLETGDVLVS